MTLHQIEGEDELERLFRAPRALVFKHSLICPASTRAFDEYARFLEEGAAVPTAWIDVIGQRPLARAVAERTGVRHESPQALYLECGEVRWHASHGAISARSLREAVGG